MFANSLQLSKPTLKLNKKRIHWSLHPFKKTWSTWKKIRKILFLWKTINLPIWTIPNLTSYLVWQKGTSNKCCDWTCLTTSNWKYWSYVHPFFGYYLHEKDWRNPWISSEDINNFWFIKIKKKDQKTFGAFKSKFNFMKWV